MIKSIELHWLIEAIVGGNRHIYMRFAYPPLFNLDSSKWYSPARWLFPEMAAERARFSKFLEQYIQECVAMIAQSKTERNDITSALLEARDPTTNEKLSGAEVWTEAHLMIAAGGDTTSTAFAAVLFYLSRNSETYARLANEIRNAFPDVESIRRGAQLRSCRYLKACLDEALRLAPAAPGALWREACTGGVTVDGVYILAGLDAGVSTYASSHNEGYFSDPFRFDPERFLNTDVEAGVESPYNSNDEVAHDSKLISLGSSEKSRLQLHNRDAFVPFSIGPRGCLAKPLAYLELSLAMARIMFLVNFEAVGALGEGRPGLDRGRQRKEEFQIVDMFSSNKQGPMLKFRARI